MDSSTHSASPLLSAALLVAALMAPLTGAGPRAACAADLILNEYNAVDSAVFLEDLAADSFWGRRPGNGDDWFELVVITDHLDIRGWQLRVADHTGDLIEESFLLTFSSHPVWADLRSGTIITISEDLETTATDYDPGLGRWWINVRALPETSGPFITVACEVPACDPAVAKWSLSNNNSQITIRDDLGATVFGPAGEGIVPASGVGSQEVLKLEADPNAAITPFSPYTDGASSTFGSPNVWSAGAFTQDFSTLRSVVPYSQLTTVRINELLTHSDPGEDWIELHNTSPQAVDVGGWFISDMPDNLTRFAIPPGTVVAAGGYVTFTQSEMGFGFSSACGDSAILSAGNGVTPTGPRDFVEFGATETGVTLGRFPDGTGSFERLATDTRGGPNSGPQIGPVVLSEIMYNPPPPAPGVSVDPEFLELLNIGASAVDLFIDYGPEGVHPWQISGGVDYVFSLDRTIPAGGYLVIVGFDPVLEPAKLTEFRAIYEIDESVTIVGPYSGKLDNFSERLRLRKPDTPEQNPDICGPSGTLDPFVPPVNVEEVTYFDFGEWPASADGTGPSLVRLDPVGVAGSPASWGPSPNRSGGPGNDNPAPPTTTTTTTTSTTTTSTTTTTTLPPSLDCGDANGTGEVSASDALHALRAAVGVLACALCRCDVDGSGSVVASDALFILQMAVGLPLSPDCPPCA